MRRFFAKNDGLMITNLTKCASIFGIQANTLKSWAAIGCPVVQHGRAGTPWRFDTRQVHAWRENHVREEACRSLDSTAYDEAKRRKAVAQASLVELDLQQRRGDLIEKSLLVRYISDVAQAFKAKVIGIGPKYGPMARAAATDAEASAIISRGTSEALRELQRVFDPEA